MKESHCKTGHCIHCKSLPGQTAEHPLLFSAEALGMMSKASIVAAKGHLSEA